jgi:2-polyprenyl-3-methyl-5-hydroxy-6-metoxy-1,4-benzoquinol methylase
MLPRILEPEVMDDPAEAALYDAMDHREVNERFARDLLAAAAVSGVVLERIVDWGTGTALIPIALCGLDERITVTAVEPSNAMQALAVRNVASAGLSGRIEIVAGGFECASGPFDAVVSNSLVHHLAKPQAAFDRALEVVRAGRLLFHRDLVRPESMTELTALVERYVPAEQPMERKLLADSLHAALTLTEVREMVGSLGFAKESVQRTSDRHWTWCAVKEL